MDALKSAIIVGAGPGLSASLARLFSSHGIRSLLASRTPEDLRSLVAETDGEAFACDASDPGDVEALFAHSDRMFGGSPDIVVYNASFRTRGPITDLDPQDVDKALRVTAFAAFLVGQAAARRMVPHGGGTILFTGASAGVKGYPRSAPFAMGKFALRGLAESMARELHPQNVHVAHVVIDGGIRNPARRDRVEPGDKPDSMLDPDAIAASYWHLVTQPRSAWSHEIALRPWVETF